MFRPHRSSIVVVALVTLLGLAACSSGDPGSTSTSGTTTTGAGGSTGTGGSGGAAPTTFACKGSMCDIGKEECDVDKNDQGACSALPKACVPNGDTKPTCACFTSLTPDCMCLQDPNGNFVIQCTMM